MDLDPDLSATEKTSEPLDSSGGKLKKRLQKLETKRCWRRSFLEFIWGCIALGLFSLVIAVGADRIWRKFRRFPPEADSGVPLAKVSSPGPDPKPELSTESAPEAIPEETPETKPEETPETKLEPSSKPSFGVQGEKLENEDEYRAFLATIPMQFITPGEVIRPHRNIRNGVKNKLPPKESWKQIREVLLVADAVRKELDVPLKRISSAFRSPGYNAECPGAVANSYHLKNLALDLIYACPAGDAARAAEKLRDKGLFKGGIGIYPTFIHIDTRGRNKKWGSELTKTDTTPVASPSELEYSETGEGEGKD